MAIPWRFPNCREVFCHPPNITWGIGCEFLPSKFAIGPVACCGILSAQRIQPVTNANFGPLVAYLLPGATVLLGVSPFSPLVKSWFAVSPDGTPTIGGFLFLTVASMGVGMTVSAIRWLIIDTLHRLTGLALPRLEFTRLGPNVEAFALLIDIHYKHFLYYGNEAIAV